MGLCCGRAGYTRAFKDHGWVCKCLDINRKFVEPSIGGEGGLDESDHIELDFLDLGVGYFLGEIELGSVDHIHDGFDCSTVRAAPTRPRHAAATRPAA